MEKNTQKSYFADSLKLALERKGYQAKASVLEREFNLKHFGKPVTLHAAAKWLRGEAIPRHDKIMTLSKWLEIPPTDLVYQFAAKEESQRMKDRWEENIGYRERELFQIFLNLPPEQKKIVREVILAFGKVYQSSGK